MIDEIDDIDEQDAELNPPAAAKRRVVRRRAKKGAKKKTQTAGAEPQEKVDVAAAYAWLKKRVAAEKDAIVKALFERELAPLEERAKKERAAQKAAADAKKFVTVDKKRCVVGDVVYRIEGYDYMDVIGALEEACEPRPHRVHRKPEPIRLEQLTCVSITLPKDTYDHKRAGFRVTGSGNQITLRASYQGGFDDLYWTPEAAIAEPLKQARENVDGATAALERAKADLAALVLIEKSKPSFPDSPASAKERKGSKEPRPTSGRAPAVKPTSARNPWTEEDDDKLWTLREAGKKIPAIAAEIGRPAISVRRRLKMFKDNGYTPRAADAMSLFKENTPDALNEDAPPSVESQAAAVESHKREEASSALETLQDEWPRLVGQAVSDLSRPESIADGMLLVRTSDAKTRKTLQTQWEMFLARRVAEMIAPVRIAALQIELLEDAVPA